MIKSLVELLLLGQSYIISAIFWINLYMNKNHSFIGSNVALITPMFIDGAVDYEALNHLIDFHIQNSFQHLLEINFSKVEKIE